MPLAQEELRDVQARVLRMFMDTITTFEAIRANSGELFGERAPQIQAAIDEYLEDFLRRTDVSGEKHPEQLIYETSTANYQRAGFYGAQLGLKERQVTVANASLRERLVQGAAGLWRRPFRKWVDVINNFLGSLASATGMGEALKELKDCLRDELPEED